MHWGSEAIDVNEKSLPSLKLSYILPYLDKPNIKVLEVGCGNGKFLNSIMEHNPSADLYGCDIRHPTADYTFSFKNIFPGQPLPYLSDSFDVIILMDVLEHVKNYRFLLSEIDRILDNNGTFIGFVPCEGETFSAYSLYKLLLGNKLYTQTKDHINQFKRGEVYSLLKDTFLDVDFIYSYHLLGQIMDATLYALMLNDKFRIKFWTENKSSFFNHLLSFANLIAYYESVLLRDVRLFSVGVHFACKKKSITKPYIIQRGAFN